MSLIDFLSREKTECKSVSAMRKDRMFNRECKWIVTEEPNLAAKDSPAESRTRTKYKRFSKVSSRFSFALQEVKKTVRQMFDNQFIGD